MSGVVKVFCFAGLLVAAVAAVPSGSEPSRFLVDDSGESPTLEIPAEVNVWGDFQYITGTKCLGGEETGVIMRKGKDPKKLAIFFAGGGACFNKVSCSQVYRDATSSGITTGVFDFSDEGNPLKDHSIVFIPYCSGDLFLGTGNTKTIELWTLPPKDITVTTVEQIFNGKVNLELLLDQLVPAYKDITHLVVGGFSAGGFGAVGNFDTIVQKWLSQGSSSQLTDLTLIDDSAPIMDNDFIPACLQERFEEWWQMYDEFPEDCTSCKTTETDGGMFNVFPFLKAKYPTAHFGFISSVADKTIASFLSFGNEDCKDIDEIKEPDKMPQFEAGLMDLVENHLGPEFPSFIMDGNAHTFLWRPEFNELESQEGQVMNEWLANVMDGTLGNGEDEDDDEANHGSRLVASLYLFAAALCIALV